MRLNCLREAAAVREALPCPGCREKANPLAERPLAILTSMFASGGRSDPQRELYRHRDGALIRSGASNEFTSKKEDLQTCWYKHYSSSSALFRRRFNSLITYKVGRRGTLVPFLVKISSDTPTNPPFYGFQEVKGCRDRLISQAKSISGQVLAQRGDGLRLWFGNG